MGSRRTQGSRNNGTVHNPDYKPKSKREAPNIQVSKKPARPVSDFAIPSFTLDSYFSVFEGQERADIEEWRRNILQKVDLERLLKTLGRAYNTLGRLGYAEDEEGNMSKKKTVYDQDNQLRLRESVYTAKRALRHLL